MNLGGDLSHGINDGDDDDDYCDYDGDHYDNGDDDADFVFSPVFHRHPLGRNWSHASPSCQQILNKNKNNYF